MTELIVGLADPQELTLPLILLVHFYMKFQQTLFKNVVLYFSE